VTHVLLLEHKQGKASHSSYSQTSAFGLLAVRKTSHSVDSKVWQSAVKV